jgi:formylglycine-generating enzyme required for sulfatase activity
MIKHVIALSVLLFFLAGCISRVTPTHDTDMAQVPAGPFLMGFVIDNDKSLGDTDEEPVHEVVLDEFWIDKYEVNSAQFSEFLNAHPEDSSRYIELGSAVTIEKKKDRYQPRAGLERHPANRVSWFGADAFCRWKGKRLPTEAEWEKAARGTDERMFPWGDQWPTNEVVTFRRKFNRLGFDVMEPVDGLPMGRSPYGVHQMAGNVWEWVADWYADDYYEQSPVNNPQGPETGISKGIRGGNWYYKAYYMRTTYRFNERPEAFNVWQGFRCAASNPPPGKK